MSDQGWFEAPYVEDDAWQERYAKAMNELIQDMSEEDWSEAWDRGLVEKAIKKALNRMDSPNCLDAIMELRRNLENMLDGKAQTMANREGE